MVRAECRESGGEQPPGRRREGREPHLAHHLAPLGLDVGLGHRHLRKDLRGVVRQQPAGVGEADPRPFLARSCCPTSRSSLAICWETAEVVT